MDTLFEIDGWDVLQGWAEARGRRRGGPRRQSGSAVAGMRFAFYGRTSTAEFQDPVTSRAWQREMAESVISGGVHPVRLVRSIRWHWAKRTGRILIRDVAFDEDHSQLRAPSGAAVMAIPRMPRARRVVDAADIVVALLFAVANQSMMG